jgi:hypothetical protein
MTNAQHHHHQPEAAAEQSVSQSVVLAVAVLDGRKSDESATQHLCEPVGRRRARKFAVYSANRARSAERKKAAQPLAHSLGPLTIKPDPSVNRERARASSGGGKRASYSVSGRIRVSVSRATRFFTHSFIRVCSYRRRRLSTARASLDRN